VILSSRRAAQVQLLVDRNAAVAALIERTRAQGVVFGQHTNTLALEYVPGTADVKQGDSVVTSGMDGIYPKGFVIGTVDIVERGPGTFHKISVRPAVDFSRLEEVLVVTTPPSIKEAQNAETALARQPPDGVTPSPALNQSPTRPAAPGNRSPAATRPLNQTPRSPQPRPVSPSAPTPRNQTPPGGTAPRVLAPNGRVQARSTAAPLETWSAAVQCNGESA
jgi:rod shape-determining protein MreC